MEDNFRNKLGFLTFLFIIAFLLIGGYFFTKYTINNLDKKEAKKENVLKDYRIDKDKDFIYYENEDVISESAEIYYKDVVINLETQKVLTETLQKENNMYKKNIKYFSDVPEFNKELVNYDNDNIYILKFRDYKDFKYGNYVSLLINDYNYDCFESVTFYETKSYVFNTKSGQLLSENDILKKYNITLDEIKEQIRTHLSSIISEESVIKVDETLEDFENYALYINEYGRLYISYLVKTTEVNYNEDMEVKV